MRLLLLLGTVALCAVNFVSIANASPTSSEKEIVSASLRSDPMFNYFSYKLIQPIVAEKSANFVCSPTAISLLLSQIASGARGRTKDVIYSALGSAGSRDSAFVDKRQRFVYYLRSAIGLDFQLSNGIFYDKTIKPKEEFTYMMTECDKQNVVRSKTRAVDFKRRNDASRLINDWVDEHSSVKNPIRPADLSPSMDLVLVNTVAFKSNWLNSFNPESTESRRFYLDDERYTNVPTMHRYGHYNHGSFVDLDAKFLELPYKKSYGNEETRMLIVVPNKKTGFAHLKKNLLRAITSERSSLNSQHPIHVHLPKFKLETVIDVEKPLKKLNLGRIFDESADFRNIADRSSVKIDKIIQIASIDVNEGPQKNLPKDDALRQAGMRRRPGHEFIVDRPFVVAIISESGIPLFVGIVTDPTSRDSPDYENNSTETDDVPEDSDEFNRDELKRVIPYGDDDLPRYATKLPSQTDLEYYLMRQTSDSQLANDIRRTSAYQHRSRSNVENRLKGREYDSRSGRDDEQISAYEAYSELDPKQYSSKRKDGTRHFVDYSSKSGYPRSYGKIIVSPFLSKKQ